MGRAIVGTHDLPGRPRARGNCVLSGSRLLPWQKQPGNTRNKKLRANNLNAESAENQ